MALIMPELVTPEQCKLLHDKLIEEDFSIYIENRDGHIGSHALANFGYCPLKYHLEVIGEIKRPESEAFSEGRAVHTLTLEGRKKFDTEYKVGGAPVNESTGKSYGPTSQKYKLWKESQELEVLSDEQFERIEKMCVAVKSHPVAEKLLSRGLAERVGRANYEGVDCQIRMDWLTPEFECGLGIVDLKTTASLDTFVWDARKFHYHNQAAFYRAVLHAIEPSIPPLPFTFVVVEKVEPYRVGVWSVDKRVLFIKEQENKKYLDQLKVCRENDHWPTLFEDIRFIETIF